MTPRLLCTLPLAGYRVEVYDRPGLRVDEQADGMWLAETRTICLDSELDADERLEVLLHECLHAVADMYGRRLGEATVRTLALGLHQMLAGVLRLEVGSEAGG